MYLTKSILSENRKHRMVGLFDAQTVMTKKMRLNYTLGKATAKPQSPNAYIIFKVMSFITLNWTMFHLTLNLPMSSRLAMAYKTIRTGWFRTIRWPLMGTCTLRAPTMQKLSLIIA